MQSTGNTSDRFEIGISFASDWFSGASFLDQLESKVMQNKYNSGLL